MYFPPLQAPGTGGGVCVCEEPWRRISRILAPVLEKLGKGGGGCPGGLGSEWSPKGWALTANLLLTRFFPICPVPPQFTEHCNI